MRRPHVRFDQDACPPARAVQHREGAGQHEIVPARVPLEIPPIGHVETIEADRAAMVTYPVFFAGTNEAFVRGGLSDSLRGGLSDSPARALLARWETWHWMRTALGTVGFVAALRALQRS